MDNTAEGMAPGPDGSFLRFFYDTARNDRASTAENRAIFDTVLVVDIITPGQKASTPRFELERIWSEQTCKALGVTGSKRSYKYTEYEEQIEKYKRMEQGDDFGGTPLKMWPRIDRGLAATLAGAHIHTVEALAQVSDGNLGNLGLGGRELREQAKAFLLAAEGGAEVSQLTERAMVAEAENKRLNDALVEANRLNAELKRGGAPDTKKKVDATLSASG
jgi:hypothetical protein